MLAVPDAPGFMTDMWPIPDRIKPNPARRRRVGTGCTQAERRRPAVRRRSVRAAARTGPGVGSGQVAAARATSAAKSSGSLSMPSPTSSRTKPVIAMPAASAAAATVISGFTTNFCCSRVTSS